MSEITLGQQLRERRIARREAAIQSLENIIRLIQEQLPFRLKTEPNSHDILFNIKASIPYEFGMSSVETWRTLSPRLDELFAWFDEQELLLASDTQGIRVIPAPSKSLYLVFRTDDNGVSYMVEKDLSEAEADALIAKQNGHKQTFAKLVYTPESFQHVVLSYHLQL